MRESSIRDVKLSASIILQLQPPNSANHNDDAKINPHLRQMCLASEWHDQALKELNSRLLREAESIRGRHGVFESGFQRLPIYYFQLSGLIQL